MDLKEIFEAVEGGMLNYEQFTKAVSDKGIKLADISKGDYVSKGKYDDEVKGLKSQIETLNGTVTSRNNDLADLQKQLETAGASTNDINSKLTELQSKYDTEMQAYQKQLSKQAYEFAVKEFANTKNFTSQAAKRDFVQTMIGKELLMEGDKIMGAEDFVTAYSVDNSDAFVVSTPPTPPTEPTKPTFVAPTTPSGNQPNEANPFSFNFTGVRPKE